MRAERDDHHPRPLEAQRHADLVAESERDLRITQEKMEPAGFQCQQPAGRDGETLGDGTGAAGADASGSRNSTAALAEEAPSSRSASGPRLRIVRNAKDRRWSAASAFAQAPVRRRPPAWMSCAVDGFDARSRQERTSAGMSQRRRMAAPARVRLPAPRGTPSPGGPGREPSQVPGIRRVASAPPATTAAAEARSASPAPSRRYPPGSPATGR